MGVISPLGSTVDLFWHLLSKGESAVKPVTSFDTSPFQACLAAEVTDFDPEDFLHRKQARRVGRATPFAAASAMMAVRDSCVDLEQEDRGAIGISIGILSQNPLFYDSPLAAGQFAVTVLIDFGKFGQDLFQ